MKKFLVILTCMFMMVGCVLDKTPKNAVIDIFKKYQKLDDAVISDLEFSTEEANLSTNEQRENYMKAMKMQYSDIKYEVTDEMVTGDNAVVTVNITVYDFYKVQKDADEYYNSHKDEFLKDNVYDAAKFMDYKLKNMIEATDRVEYTIVIDLEKEDDEWVAKPFDKTTLEKIHGTYNYEKE